MRIERVVVTPIRLPTAGRTALPVAGVDGPAPAPAPVYVLAQVFTDSGAVGTGVTAAPAGWRSVAHLLSDELAPLVVGTDPRHPERTAARIAHELASLGPGGLFARAYAALDWALWDLAGQSVGVPCARLWGHTRASVPVILTEVGLTHATPAALAKAAKPFLQQGVLGLHVEMSGCDPAADSERIEQIRGIIGNEPWLSVTAKGRFDAGTALALGRFFGDELDLDWFEDALPPEPTAAWSRLADRLEVPLAAGAHLDTPLAAAQWAARGTVQVLRLDPSRIGGPTAFLQATQWAEQHGVRVVPVGLPELCVQLAGGRPNVPMLEWPAALSAVWAEPLALEKGRLPVPARSGLGLSVASAALTALTLPLT
jgi:L-alanine-DL-glutamate epimerase-like enolase superfamily enzyme